MSLLFKDILHVHLECDKGWAGNCKIKRDHDPGTYNVFTLDQYRVEIVNDENHLIIW